MSQTSAAESSAQPPSTKAASLKLTRGLIYTPETNGALPLSGSPVKKRLNSLRRKHLVCDPALALRRPNLIFVCMCMLTVLGC